MITATKPERRTGRNGANVLAFARPITVDEFYRVAAADVFGDEERLELVDGVIMPMAPIGPRHARGVTRGSRWFGEHLPPVATVRSQNPVRLAIDSELIPDIAIVMARDDDYGDRHPRPEEVYLLIDVSDTSLRYDRDVKLPRYARAGIREVWIGDLEHRELRAYRQPRRGRYGEHLVVVPGGTVAPQAFPELALTVDLLLA